MPPPAVALLAGVFGLIFGSFVTVLVHRVPRKESIVAPGSRCPSCGDAIRARDNIPVVSYVLLRGRCRSCDRRIPIRYPLTELVTAGLFAASGYGFASEPYVAAMLAVFFGLLLAISLIDVERRIIPNAIVYPSVPLFVVLILVGWALGAGLQPQWGLVGFLGYGGILLLIALIYPAGMGMGDVKLAALIGLVLGSLGPAFPAVAAALGFFAGGIGGILVLLITGGGRKQTIPFGPYLAGGAVLAAFAAPAIVSWYLGLLS